MKFSKFQPYIFKGTEFDKYNIHMLLGETQFQKYDVYLAEEGKETILYHYGHALPLTNFRLRRDYSAISRFESDHIYMNCPTSNFARAVVDIYRETPIITKPFSVRVIGKVLYSRNCDPISGYDPSLNMPYVYGRVGRWLDNNLVNRDMVIWNPDNTYFGYEMSNVDFDVTIPYSGTATGDFGIGCHSAFYYNQAIEVRIYSIRIIE